MIDFKKLTEPFNENDIEWRLQQCGSKNGRIWARCLAYVSNRAIQNRLDEVVGAENWQNIYKEITPITVSGKLVAGSTCGISIRITRDDGTSEWVTKWDGSDNTDIEAVKGGLSGAMKRAAVQWGIGRYLYNLKENFAIVSDDGKYSGKTKEGTYFKWSPPKLPDWALPNASKVTPPVTPPKALTKAEQDELNSLKSAVLDYLNSGLLKGNYAEKATKNLDANDIVALRKTIAYCKKQESA